MWNSSVSFLALPIYGLFLVCYTCINVCQMSIYLIYLKLCGFYFNATLCFQLLSITNIVYFLWRLEQAIKSFGQAHDCVVSNSSLSTQLRRTDNKITSLFFIWILQFSPNISATHCLSAESETWYFDHSDNKLWATQNLFDVPQKNNPAVPTPW